MKARNFRYHCIGLLCAAIWIFAIHISASHTVAQTAAKAPIITSAASQAKVDTLIANNWLGPSGTGDQGGFILLSFPHVDGIKEYNILRQEPSGAFSSWASVSGMPDQGIIRVLVPVFDNLATRWAVAPAKTTTATDDRLQAAMDDRRDILGAVLNAQPDTRLFTMKLTTTDSAVAAHDDIPPVAVQNITITTAANGLHLQWDLSADDAEVSRYEIWRQIGDGRFKNIATVPRGDSVFVDTDVPANSRLAYRVDAADNDNTTLGSTVALLFPTPGH